MLVPAWASSNTTSNSARATTLGLLAGMQNIAGIISSYSFIGREAPVFRIPETATLLTDFHQVYRTALIVTGSFQGGMILTTSFAWFYYWRINKELDSGKRRYAVGMEENPGFRYVV